ncbi:hypothetical protein CY0110_31040, partial [Crocosphaera chwakensis CCY0110]
MLKSFEETGFPDLCMDMYKTNCFVDNKNEKFI